MNKFLALLLRTEKLLSGSTRSLAYIDHIIQFGLNKFLAPLSNTEKLLGGSTRSLGFTDHIIEFGLNRNPQKLIIMGGKFKRISIEVQNRTRRRMSLEANPLLPLV